MKKMILFVLTIAALLSITAPASAMYSPPSRVTPTKEDLAVGENFFKNLKWDLSKAASGQITLILPKLPTQYTVGVKERIMNENNGTIFGKVVHQGTGGVTISIATDKKLRSGVRFDLGNSDTSANIAYEFYIYTPGTSTIKYLPFDERRWPVYDENGKTDYWLDDLGNRINEDGTPYDPKNPNPPKSVFKDVKSTFWGFKDINTLAGSGYIKGYPDGTFRPENKITRAEFMVTLWNVLQDKWSAGKSYNHAGEKEIITSTHWSYNAVTGTFKYLPKNDISLIFGNNFMPDQYITREEVVAVLASVLSVHTNFKNPPGSVALSDVDTSKFPDSIWFSAKHNLVTGYPDFSFRPLNSITRAEITAVMVRMIEKL